MDSKMFNSVKVLALLATVTLILGMAGCAGAPKRKPVPPELTTKVGTPA